MERKQNRNLSLRIQYPSGQWAKHVKQTALDRDITIRELVLSALRSYIGEPKGAR